MFRPLRWVCAIALALACSSDPTVYTLTSDQDTAKADGTHGITITALVMKGDKYLDRGNVTFSVDVDGASFREITDSANPPKATDATTSVSVSAGMATIRLYSVTQGSVTVTGVFKDDVARTTDRKTITVSFTGAAIPLSSFEFLGADPAQVPIGGSSKVRFMARDSAGKAVSNLDVAFTVAPEGTATVEPVGKTGTDGTVTTTLTAGDTAGSVVVTITGGVGEYQRSLNSSAIAISGGILNGKNLTLACTAYSIAGFEMEGLETECVVYGSDYNKAFVPDSQVLFMTEAGGVPQSVAFSADAANGGVAKFIYRTQCAQPRDVNPLGPVYGDEGTDCVFYNTCKTPPVQEVRSCNPRDGLATLVAYSTGQEPFTDSNGNQTWDPGEAFEDLSEPFVDANDNGLRDDDEDFYDANKNGRWDDKNGTWDAKTTIWRMVKIWWTGAPQDLVLSPGNNQTITHCTPMKYTGYLTDFNGNPPTATAASDAVQATCDSGCTVKKVDAYEDKSGMSSNDPGLIGVTIGDAHGCPAECVSPGCGPVSFSVDLKLVRTLDGKKTQQATNDLGSISGIYQ